MNVVFTPPAQHIQQIAWACRDAGIHYATATAAPPVPSIACEFDDPAELITWHSEFVTAYGWAPYDYAESTDSL
ncbi:MAG: hypothetical protein OEU26_28125 [Candidatus Tectomicrobia bacterium]|nr:hypothetical protein [Candidatus Tectomicrobia bacterium]